MRSLVAAVALMTPIVGCGSESSAPPRILNQCPAGTPACVEMLLDAPTLAGVLRARSPADSIGFADMTLAVPGHFGSAPSAIQHFLFRAFPDGMECSAFGQGNAAVVGFSERREPIILTTAGAFTVTGGALEAGCPDCLRVRGEPTAYPTPSWDLTLTRHRVEQFGFLNTGEPVLRSSTGCVVLERKFVFLPADACIARLSGERVPDVTSRGCT